MQFIRVVFALVMIFAAGICGLLATVVFSASPAAGLILGLMCIAALIVAVRRLQPRDRETPVDEQSLRRWHSAESRPVERPRDPRTRACLESIGKEIAIRYSGRELRITPLRVYTKPKYRKTYVDAVSEGEERTYNIDEMELR